MFSQLRFIFVHSVSTVKMHYQNIGGNQNICNSNLVICRFHCIRDGGGIILLLPDAGMVAKYGAWEPAGARAAVGIRRQRGLRLAWYGHTRTCACAARVSGSWVARSAPVAGRGWNCGRS
jgi:hypothetical protein